MQCGVFIHLYIHVSLFYVLFNRKRGVKEDVYEHRGACDGIRSTGSQDTLYGQKGKQVTCN